MNPVFSSVHPSRDRSVPQGIAPATGSPTLDFGLLQLRSRQAQEQHAAGDRAGRRKQLLAVRTALVAEADALAAQLALHRGCTPAEALATEIIPLADALNYNARRFAKILATRHPGTADRPAWLTGVRSEVQRQPLGLVLVIAPGNYPLYLAAVPAVQAIAAGNAVWIKPAPGTGPVVSMFRELFVRAGFMPELIQVLPESTEAAQAAIDAGVDKVVFTGSAETGRKILARLAPRLTPAVMELSGCDAVFLRNDADLNLAARAIAFGLSINRGATCIAPRRLFVPRRHVALFTRLLREELQARPPLELGPTACERWLPWVKNAVENGAYVVSGTLHSNRVTGPLVLSGTQPEMRLLQEDTFAPVAGIVTVEDDEEALTAAARCPYALGAAVFGRNRAGARRLAGRIRAGSVVVNDLIAPTADPRIPFGGVGQSGFGVTRGDEGLLEMTAPKVVLTNTSGRRLHYRPFDSGDTELFHALLQLGHGPGVLARLRALVRTLTLFRNRPKHPRRPDAGPQES